MNEYVCKFCGKVCKNDNSLRNHERLCYNNPNQDKHSLNCLHEGAKNYNNRSEGSWNKGLTKETNKTIEKISETSKKRFKEGKIVIWNKNKKQSKEHNKHISDGCKKYIEENKLQSYPRISVKACEYIDKLNKEKNWNLQHGQNGGEIRCGRYFIDGYDKELNIVFEYDEAYHYSDVQNNILNEKDIERMNKIKNKLKCKFFRYNEELDLLYEVT